jgi:hypothetical protein
MKITVDSRGCGEGKTTTCIYPFIRSAIELNELTLLIVPSIKLQNEYQKEFQNQITVINGFGAVKATLEALINKPTPIVCITQECWLLSQINDVIKSQWNLIIDEAIMPFRSLKYDRRGSVFDWSSIIQLNISELQAMDDTNYYPITINEPAIDNWTRTSEAIKDLMDPNYTSEMGVKTWDQLQTETGSGRVEIFQQLRIEMVQAWRSIHIAAAAFEHTMMSYWLKHHKLNYTIGIEFIERELPVRFHHILGLDWSKSKQLDARYNIVQQEYKNYVNQYCRAKGIKSLALRNNSSSMVLDNEQKINHNPHGWNEFRNYTAISLESALNPTKEFSRWLQYRIGMEYDAITLAFSAYLFYQSIMRTCLRNKDNQTEVDVFVIDEKTLFALMKLMITNLKDGIIEIPTSYVKPQAMTSNERRMKHYYKEKCNENHNTSYMKIVTFSAVNTDITPGVPKPNSDHSAHLTTVLPGTGPHAGKIHCVTCNRHVRWLTKEEYRLKSNT